MTASIVRFMGKIETSPTGCWLWNGARNRDGYGSFWNGERLQGRDGKRGGPRMVLAHRWSYEHHHGAIPKGVCVLHRCDTPACVNPDHLFLGTQRVNVADCAAKGRRNQARGSSFRHYPKLSPEAHAAIARRVVGGAPRRQLAEEYGVATQTIDYIVRHAAAPASPEQYMEAA